MWATRVTLPPRKDTRKRGKMALAEEYRLGIGAEAKQETLSQDRKGEGHSINAPSARTSRPNQTGVTLLIAWC